jgi:hypothetical protein
MSEQTKDAGGQTDPYDGTGTEMTTGEAAANAPADDPADEQAAISAEEAARQGAQDTIEHARNEGKGESPAAAKRGGP